MKKKTVAVLFGGMSNEHEVSCRSAGTVLRALDAARYAAVVIGITRGGQWLQTDASIEDIASGAWEAHQSNRPAWISPVYGAGLYIDGQQKPLDCVFPVLHGKNGEDGTVQGLLTLAGIPFVGCGVAASAACMDKIFTKMICAYAGIRQAKWTAATRTEIQENPERVAAEAAALGYPLFVKPANAGSSVGVTKVKTPDALDAALHAALQHDSRILIEENIDGLELETAVLGNAHPVVSGVGQVLPGQEYYTYEAKYNDETSKTLLRAEISDAQRNEVRNTAAQVFRLMDGKGLSRVDFFLRRADHAVVFNEINTMPGFTSISMYPKLFEDAGIDNRTLVTRLIELALEA